MPTIHTLLWATETHACVFDVYDDRARALQTARNIARAESERYNEAEAKAEGATLNGPRYIVTETGGHIQTVLRLQHIPSGELTPERWTIQAHTLPATEGHSA